MGGFRFCGPNYIINNKPSDKGYTCKCMGFICDIAEDIETFLVNKEDKTLVIDELPTMITSKMKNCHLGDTMKYDINVREQNNNRVIGLKHIYSFSNEYSNPTGFYFQGPNYIITNINTNTGSCKCYRCINNICNISEEIETLLVDEHDKILELSKLPVELQFDMRSWNLGDTLHYEVIPRNDDNVYKSKKIDFHVYSYSKFDTIEKENYKNMFSPIHLSSRNEQTI